MALHSSWFLRHCARGNHAAAPVLGESAWRTAAGVWWPWRSTSPWGGASATQATAHYAAVTSHAIGATRGHTLRCVAITRERAPAATTGPVV